MLRLLGFLVVVLGGRHTANELFKQGSYAETAAMRMIADDC